MRHTLSRICGLAAILLAAPVFAAEPTFMADPIYDSPLFNFEGFYIGAQAGGAILAVPGTVGVVGLVAGANFALSDALIAGLEFQGEALFNGAGFVGADALLLARAGTYVTQDMLAYGALGAGMVAGAGAYAFGAGIEMPLMEQLSARGEVLGIGGFGGGPSGAKATAGLLWHLN